MVDYFGFPKSTTDVKLGFRTAPNPPAWMGSEWVGQPPMVVTGPTWTHPSFGGNPLSLAEEDKIPPVTVLPSPLRWADLVLGRTLASGIYVYTNIVDYSIVGNFNAPLLDIVPVGAGNEQASREVHFTIQPAVDVFQSGRYLVPGVSIVIQIDFNDPQFVLMAAADCTSRFKITSAVFRVRHNKVQAAVHLEVEDKQYKQQQTVLYPIRTSKPIRRTLKAGKSFVSFTDLFQQSVPDHLTIGFVKSTAFNGAYNENPYNFKLFGLKDLRMVVNETERPINRIEFKSHDGVEGYEMMFSSTGNMHRGFSNSIKRKDYAHGNALLCINLTPDGKRRQELHMPTEGGLDSQQLRWLVRTDRRLHPSFLGVFPADRLPSTRRPGTGLIANTDLSDQPGTHWVAMYLDDDGQAEFFDSYGQTPHSYHPS
ncbi:hypothetical protein QZH41_018850 [Actinostola sp. cb2023]|nr:hypothetical protein QZH41_018850 [Actinostola sp. cb2023]